jgi:hypothetical protein
MTRLTRREVNGKLGQIPVFFVSTDGGMSVYTGAEQKGHFFTDKVAASKLADSMGYKVGATTLDDVFFTLVEKKAKLGKFLKGVAATSDPSATYDIIASTNDITAAGPNWAATNPSDIPLFRMQNVAFQKPDGMELPLFMSKEDAFLAFDRLEMQKKETQEPSINTAGKVPSKPLSREEALQVTSLRKLLGVFDTGGVEARALEIYPTMDNIDAARSLIKQ